MADLSLKIKADFDEAQAQFKALADTSEYAQDRIKRFSESFTNKKLDEFIDKQKMAANAITATKGSLAAAEAQNAAYKREIERLIKSGLEPNSDAVKKLVTEKKKLEAEIKKTTDAQKAQADIMKFAEKAAAACFAAIAAGVTATAALIQKTAEAGDAAAKTSRTVGMTAETFQELQYAAKQSGVDDLTPSLLKLNNTIAEVKNGSGALTKVLEDNNKTLLKQLQGAKSNEQAFNLLMDAIKAAPDEFTRAELATAAFGKAGQGLINMALEGTEGLSALREEARKYGVISNEAALASEEYMNAQDKLKAALTGVSQELSAKLMPGITEAINKASEFIVGIDNWEDILRRTAIALGATAAALTTFIIASKSHAIVTAMAGAIRGLVTALSGPAGIAALAVGGLVIAISSLAEVSKKQAEQGKIIADNLTRQQTEVDNLKLSYSNLNTVRDIDAGTISELLRLYPELSDMINDQTISVNDLNDAIIKKDYDRAVGEAQKFIISLHDTQKGIDDFYKKFGTDTLNWADNIGFFDMQKWNRLNADLNKNVKNANDILATVGARVDTTNGFQIVDTEETIIKKLAENERKAEAERNRAAREAELARRRAAEAERKAEAERNKAAREAEKRRKEEEKKEAEEKARIQKALNDTLATLDYEYNIKSFKSNSEALQAKKLLLAEKLLEMKSVYAENSDELIKAERDYKLQIIEIDNQLLEEQKLINEERKQMVQDLLGNMLGAISGFAEASLNIQKTSLDDKIKTLENTAKKELEVENITAEQKKAIEDKLQKDKQDLIDSANEKAHAAAVAQRAIANAEAFIQTYLTASKALAVPPAPNFPMMAASIAAGLANVAKINSTPIPKLSAETGGQFIVPDLSPRVDGVNFSARLSSKETVKIEPRGEHNADTEQYIFKINEQVIFNIVNRGGRSGAINVFQPARNI